MSDTGLHPYYRDRKAQILTELEQSLQLARQHFDELLPDHPLEALRAPILAEFDRVYPTIPYVGGASGRMTPFFEQGAGVIALGRVLRARGVPPASIAMLIRKTFVARLASLPLETRLALGRSFLSDENQALMRQAAAASMEHPNPADFVYRFVEAASTGEDEPFDFGIDYIECGFCKMCRSHGDEDLLPHICALDSEFYALRGIELMRTTTLAGGDSRCNFRFRAIRDLSRVPGSGQG